jgi:D-alanine-D-alanine ligase
MQNLKSKKTVAVFFGGRTPEHDVSIITGLQALKAIDSSKFEAFPVYIAPNGEWLVGKELLNTANYMLTQESINKLHSVTLDLGSKNNGRLLLKKKSLFGSVKSINFDIALLAMHGIHGEDGQLPAVMEIANIPYTGMRHFGSTVLMNKIATKRILQAVNIPVLPCHVILRPENGLIIANQILQRLVAGVTFPSCVKPCNLGSSIGVAKVNNMEELAAVLPDIFKYDYLAMVEPFVENLVEYNISVGLINGKIVTSAIEQPKCAEDLLDFKQKYVSGNNSGKLGKAGSKTPTSTSTGMLSLTRELNPKLNPAMESNFRVWSQLAFNSIQGSGFPRIDFLCNSKTGQVWLNEINPCPGSFAFYLWEANKNNPILFTELLNILLTEAEILHNKQQLPVDLTPIDARLFPRKN